MLVDGMVQGLSNHTFAEEEDHSDGEKHCNMSLIDINSPAQKNNDVNEISQNNLSNLENLIENKEDIENGRENVIEAKGDSTNMEDSNEDKDNIDNDDDEEGGDEDEAMENPETDDRCQMLLMTKEREVLSYRSGERIRVLDVVTKREDLHVIHRTVLNSRNQQLRHDEFDGRRKSCRRSLRILKSGRVSFQWDLSHWGEVVRERLLSIRELAIQPHDYNKWARTTQVLPSGSTRTLLSQPPKLQPLSSTAKVQPVNNSSTLDGHSSISLIQPNSFGCPPPKGGDSWVLPVLDRIDSSTEQQCSNKKESQTPKPTSSTTSLALSPELYHLLSSPCSNSDLTLPGVTNSRSGCLENTKFLTVTSVDTSQVRTPNQSSTLPCTGDNIPTQLSTSVQRNSTLLNLSTAADSAAYPLSIIASKQQVYAERLTDALDFGINVSIPNPKTNGRRLDLTVCGASSSSPTVTNSSPPPPSVPSSATAGAPNIIATTQHKKFKKSSSSSHQPQQAQQQTLELSASECTKDHSDSAKASTKSAIVTKRAAVSVTPGICKSKSSLDLHQRGLTKNSGTRMFQIGNSIIAGPLNDNQLNKQQIGSNIPQCLVLLNTLAAANK